VLEDIEPNIVGELFQSFGVTIPCDAKARLMDKDKALWVAATLYQTILFTDCVDVGDTEI